MGLLDDAIREHLELKRQRGTDPGEVERLEREALGPVVRGDELAPDVTTDLEHEFGPESPLAVGEAEEAYDYAETLEELPPEHLEAAHDPVVEPVAEPHPEPPTPVEPAPPAAPSEHAGQPTEEFDVESAHAAEDAAANPPGPENDREQRGEGEHDVLEDTPDFLQETPEHDRLWFEQAPPQDFDFDK